MGKKIKLKKTDKIFILIILLELISLILIYFFLTYPCPSNYTCNRYSFLNPFGYNVVCPDTSHLLVDALCHPRPHQLFYLFTDLLILTIITYLIYLGINKLKKSKSKKWEN